MCSCACKYFFFVQTACVCTSALAQFFTGRMACWLLLLCTTFVSHAFSPSRIALPSVLWYNRTMFSYAQTGVLDGQRAKEVPIPCLEFVGTEVSCLSSGVRVCIFRLWVLALSVGHHPNLWYRECGWRDTPCSTLLQHGAEPCGIVTLDFGQTLNLISCPFLCILL